MNESNSVQRDIILHIIVVSQSLFPRIQGRAYLANDWATYPTRTMSTKQPRDLELNIEDVKFADKVMWSNLCTMA